VAHKYFGERIEIVSCPTFRSVARCVEQGEADYGVMAIENSIAGSILSNYKILQNHNLQVAGEGYLRIKQNLMALPGTKLEDRREVHSHPMALLQCMDYLDEHGWKLVESEDTAFSAREISEKQLRGTAAIASTLSAKIYGLEIVAPEINTIKSNYTRFMILKPHDGFLDPFANKASLYFKTEHERGSLLKVLEQTGKENVNLSKLQSYPIPDEPWHYLFHIDMEFDYLDDYLRTIEKMERYADEIHVYGVYRQGFKQSSENTDEGAPVK
jgi:prephenate dehydratase